MLYQVVNVQTKRLDSTIVFAVSFSLVMLAIETPFCNPWTPLALVQDKEAIDSHDSVDSVGNVPALLRTQLTSPRNRKGL